MRVYIYADQDDTVTRVGVTEYDAEARLKKATSGAAQRFRVVCQTGHMDASVARHIERALIIFANRHRDYGLIEATDHFSGAPDALVLKLLQLLEAQNMAHLQPRKICTRQSVDAMAEDQAAAEQARAAEDERAAQRRQLRRRAERLQRIVDAQWSRVIEWTGLALLLTFLVGLIVQWNALVVTAVTFGAVQFALHTYISRKEDRAELELEELEAQLEELDELGVHAATSTHADVEPDYPRYWDAAS